MSEHKIHWYQIGVNYIIEGGAFPIPYAYFCPSTEKYEDINMKMITQFADLAAKQIQNNNPEVKIINLIATSVSYLGYMSNEEFDAK